MSMNFDPREALRFGEISRWSAKMRVPRAPSLEDRSRPELRGSRSFGNSN